jgi:hypothetical protein
MLNVFGLFMVSEYTFPNSSEILNSRVEAADSAVTLNVWRFILVAKLSEVEFSFTRGAT